MADQFMGRCGIDCTRCTCREEAGCPGCQATDGKPFWGACEVAVCCIGKELEHCGQCQDFPCPTLNEYSYDSEHGDNGLRISNLRGWNAVGYDAWRAEMQ